MPSDNDGVNEYLHRGEQHHNRWASTAKTVGKVGWRVAKAALLRREPEAWISARNVVNDLNTRDFDEDLEARDFDEELEARDECACPEARDFVEPRDYHEALERRGHHW